MRIITLITLLYSSLVFSQQNTGHKWAANWIVCGQAQDIKNSWIVATKEIDIDTGFSNATINIAVDSKYWLWINDQLVVFEGGLKRGPTKNDTYYDKLDVSKQIKTGKNTITVLYWYFGKSGFSHNSSGKAGLLFELFTDNKLRLISDKTWFMAVHPAYRKRSKGRQPNFRLSESNIVYDAQKELKNWPKIDTKLFTDSKTVEIGTAGCPPWNKLYKRPIPLWKDFGLKAYLGNRAFPFVSNGDTIKCKLPYNAQFTPYLKIESHKGEKIKLLTDNYLGGGVPNLWAAYITKNGVQEYESLGWINGHEMYYIIPKGVKVLGLKYRETGYDTEFAGSFHCNDEKLNTLWKKAQRTLYITMRDNYMDCPDRERAQWWGDAVLEIEESFYALDPKAHLLARKGILELMNWQKADHTISSPIPGSFKDELPMQMLASVGYYGFWNYFLHTGDTATIAEVFPKVKKYLTLWTIEEDGLVKQRKGGWTWGDWGKNKDMPILYNTWFYLANKGYASMADVLQDEGEKAWAIENMRSIEQNFNKTFWKGSYYQASNAKDKIDDRANAMAVLTGLAKTEFYPDILALLKKQEHASPYMEKYIIEALFKMGYDDFALERLKKRFAPMIESNLTTLWEGWGIGNEGFGGGTYNHAWSGGGLSLLSKYVVGISPLAPGYKIVEIRPNMGGLMFAQAEISSVEGIIKVKNKFIGSKNFVQEISVAKNIDLVVYPPKKANKVLSIVINDEPISTEILKSVNQQKGLRLCGGEYKIIIEFE